MKSIWQETIKIEYKPQLSGDIKTDVLIIGGGIAGVLCAHFLHEAGVDYILVEGDRVGRGITANTTAKITSQHGLIYQKLLKNEGIEKAKMYLKANQNAVSQYKKLCANIDCDFEEKDAYVYSMDDRQAIEKEIAALHKIGFGAEFETETELPFYIAGSVKFTKQAQFHPLKFISSISKNLNIYENTFIKELAPRTAITDNGKITAEHIIIATHFPFLNKHGSYFLKMYQSRSYCIALENAPNLNGMYREEKQDGLSFRNYKDLLIIGGGGHRTGHKGDAWQELWEFAETAYPSARECYAWATQDCMSLDSIPYIGRYSKQAEGLYVATGFNKWGMTSSMVSAQILTDIILGKKNEFAEVFSPQRNMIKPQLFLNGITAVSNLFGATKPRCPHMGCALKWNNAERTWDCPCHGSRFEKNGKLINNPATGDLPS